MELTTKQKELEAAILRKATQNKEGKHHTSLWRWVLNLHIRASLVMPIEFMQLVKCHWDGYEDRETECTDTREDWTKKG